jgi:hypothetical protein
LQRELHLNYHQKHTENDILIKTSEAKKFVKIFYEVLLIFKKIFCSSRPGLILIFTKEAF